MAGINRSGQRPKAAKHLRAGTQKKFRNDDPSARERYALKVAARLKRREKKTRKTVRKASAL